MRENRRDKGKRKERKEGREKNKYEIENIANFLCKFCICEKCKLHFFHLDRNVKVEQTLVAN